MSPLLPVSIFTNVSYFQGKTPEPTTRKMNEYFLRELKRYAGASPVVAVHIETELTFAADIAEDNGEITERENKIIKSMLRDLKDLKVSSSTFPWQMF